MNSLKTALIRIIKKHRPTRKELEHALRECRRNKDIKEIIGPVIKTMGRKIPKLPSMQQIQKLLDVIEEDGNLKFRLLVKLLLYTGLRCSELTNIKISDINLADNKIFVNQGKGNKDRYVLIFKDFRDLLVLYIKNNPKNIYLFENRFYKKYSERYIRGKFKEYCEKAKLQRIHPHLIRHVFITYLTKIGWTDEQIMLLSGHTSKDSLKIYQHLALPDIEKKFHDDLKGMGI